MIPPLDLIFEKKIYSLMFALLIFLTLGNCSTSKENESWILGFPIQDKVLVYNSSHEPIGELNKPWLFKKSQLHQSGDLVPLSNLDRGNKYWHVDAYVKRDAIITLPPERYNISERWTIVPLHPAQDGTHVEKLMVRDLGNEIELRISIDLQSARYYRHPK